MRSEQTNVQPAKSVHIPSTADVDVVSRANQLREESPTREQSSPALVLPHNLSYYPIATTIPIHVPDVILFYNKNEPWYEFTNFFCRPVAVDGKLWPTTEHYFQVGND